MNYNTATLPNGIRIIHAVNDSPISYCGIMINSGTRDEYDDESGLAHFTEHMLYKGTQKRRAHHIINRMEDVGGELNAFTSKEEIGLYSVFFEEYLERSIELIADMIFNSQFSEEQIEREREVILDEINSYLDIPSALIYDDFEQALFKNHELGNPILGTPESLRCITSEKIRKYVERQFKVEQMVFFSMGRTPFSKVMKKAEKYFSIYSSSSIEAKVRTTCPISSPNKTIVKKDTHQSHVLLGRTTFNMFDPERIALYLLNSILGGLGMNSRLNTSLREKNGLVYTVESTHALYTDSGVFTVYFGCDPENTTKCLNLIQKEFHKLRHTLLTPQQLVKAKKQLRGELGIAGENKESLVLDMAKSFLHYNKYVNLTELSELIQTVTAEEIQQVANILLLPDEFSLLHYSS